MALTGLPSNPIRSMSDMSSSDYIQPYITIAAMKGMANRIVLNQATRTLYVDVAKFLEQDSAAAAQDVAIQLRAACSRLHLMSEDIFQQFFSM